MTTSWKDRLAGEMPEAWSREIDIYETQLVLRKAGKIEERLFAETRLRRGAYGQRYDNGQRHDGFEVRTLPFPSNPLTKGPVTAWDAPGMQRIKLPMGRVTADELDALAECAEEYSDGILHITTRQDIQLHFVHIDDTPDMMRRLAAAGITTREACGNSVRNITACPYAGVCSDQAFDVTPYANAATWFLMGHDDTQDFGRKFKIAFSGCEDHPCGLVNFHDLGAIAKKRIDNGVETRGFAVYMGGGLGSVPQSAKVLDEFVPEAELLPLIQAVCRVFSKTGERENRARARFKFVIKKLGLDEVKRMIHEERKLLRDDPKWTSYLSDLKLLDEKPNREATPLGKTDDAVFEAWRATNVMKQAQAGYVVATLAVPLGDMTSEQARALSNLARKYAGGMLRVTVEQNACLRWISEGDLPAVFAELRTIGLAEGGAGTITDMTACPGTDTCKLGISASRGLAGELRRHLTVIGDKLDPAARALHVKMSGCFNSCGQHHVADIGFLGVSRNVGGRRVPHFQVVVGGEWENNGGSFGLAIGAVPSKNVPALLDDLTSRFVKEKSEDEKFSAFVQRVGKKAIRAMIEARSEVPAYEIDPSFYSDWGDPREYTIGDMGVGECAGEVVPFVVMGLAASEREVFEAQLLLDENRPSVAAQKAYAAMLGAARALTREVYANIGEDPTEIVREFRERLVEAKIFFDPFAGAKFAQYLFRAKPDGEHTRESAHQLIEEAQLFVDASYTCYERILETQKPAAVVGAGV